MTPVRDAPGAHDDAPLAHGRRPSEDALAAFAQSAIDDDRRLVVGALISDDVGRLYLQRRTSSRALFPGAWDLVGGHAESGEGVMEALAREVFEETGWRLTVLGPVVEVIDWEEGGVRRREVDLLVRVAGDLADPRLEIGKHSEGRWVSEAEVEALAADHAAANAATDPGAGPATEPAGPDAWVFKVMRLAFGLSREGGRVRDDVDGG